MSTTESNSLIQYKDKDGNIHIIYPVTKAENVDGIEDVSITGNAGTATALKMQDIPENSDLNNYLTPGFYGTRNSEIAKTILNSPLKVAFSLLVHKSFNTSKAEDVVQIVQNISTSKILRYIRAIYREGSTTQFGEWEKFILESDLDSALTGYLPLSGGTVTGTLITDGSFQNISGGNQKGGFFKYPGTTGGLASPIFTFHETEEDAKNSTNIKSIIGHFSSGNTPNYIYLAVLDPESDKNSWDQSQGLTIGKNFLRWKGTDIITKNNVASKTSAGLMSASDKTKLDGIVTMTGATTSAAGKSGLVPAPAAGSATRYLRSDGTWQVPPNTTYTLSSFGITATAAELNKLDGATVTSAEINHLDGVTSNVQTQLNSKLSKSGGTMTGALTLSGDPTAASHAVNKSYVDDSLSGKLDKSGGTMTGALTLSGDPSSNLHAATKQYVDNAVNSKSIKIVYGTVITGGIDNPNGQASASFGGVFTKTPHVSVVAQIDRQYSGYEACAKTPMIIEDSLNANGVDFLVKKVFNSSASGPVTNCDNCTLYWMAIGE